MEEGVEAVEAGNKGVRGPAATLLRQPLWYPKTNMTLDTMLMFFSGTRQTSGLHALPTDTIK